MTKTYTAVQAAKLSKVRHNTFRQRLWRDSKKPTCERRYPNAYKPEGSRDWIIPASDLGR